MMNPSKPFFHLIIMAVRTVICLVATLTLLSNYALCDEHDHRYNDNDEVVLWMNTVGPYPNHQETYNYYSLPFCRGSKKEISHYHETLGEAILGVELEFSGLDIRFKQGMPETKFCSVHLTEEKYQKFVYAIKNLYSYQMYIDDLPIEGLIGEFKEDEHGTEAYYLYTHKEFSLGYNQDRIVEVNVSLNNQPKLLEPNTNLDFTYSVTWTPSTVRFSDRFDRYLDPTVFKPRIHWFSIINSFMLVVFLIGLVSMILMRTLRKDYARYSRDEFDDIERDMGDDYGWKNVHSDVFRNPQHPLALSVLVGTGYHIAAVAATVIVLAIVAELYTERGSLLNTTIYTYSLLSFVNGYFGGGLYSQFGGRKWIRQMLFSAFMFPSIVCGTAFMINFIALYYHASRAIPFGAMVYIACIGLFINLPLTLAGTIMGRNLRGQANYPCRVSSVPRPIPYKKWYMEPSAIMLLGGILPFGSISIEMYFIFTSFWTFKIYYVYGFMLVVFFIAIAVTVCVDIVCTYILLNGEDHRWQWTSFLTGASTSLYVYLYSFYYFLFKTKMYGLFQTAFYFGHMALFSMALGIMLGAMGYVGTSLFVRKIYSTVKID
ncbi:Transmembrane 9 superfamily member 3 [Fragariocoptes setiger]|uniref:Transmembrane 9 superfamily member n=1 Tax=Fragariocoptes setiger TaxID=1670756 RepID=A0ABQ7SAA3_9ACAR|nr:Transmembrane 9 superfamily member 3 [Fragariocoptes setiger]